MTNKRNLYRILHIQHDAPPEIIRASFRTLMQSMRMHPDLGGDAKSAQLINKAYEVLSDPDKRLAYDNSLEKQQHPMIHRTKRLASSKPSTQWQKFSPPEF